MKNVGNFIFSIWLILVGLSRLILPTDEGKINFFFSVPRFSLVKPFFPYLGLIAGAFLLVQVINNIQQNKTTFLVALWTIVINLIEMVGLLNSPVAYVGHALGIVAGYFLLKDWQQAQKASLVVEDK